MVAVAASIRVDTGPSTLEDVTQRVRLHCLQNRIRVEQFFRDFDRLRVGCVTRDQFKRAIHMGGLSRSISDSEYDLIFAEFVSEKDPAKVNYARFCDTIDEVFTRKKLEKNPTAATIPQSTRTFHLQEGPRVLSEHEERVLDKLTSKFVAETRSRGMMLKEFFRDFDKHRCGRVTPSQFARAFPFPIDEDELNILRKKYVGEGGNICYLQWVQDIDSLVAGNEHTVTTSLGLPHSPGRAEHTLDGLLDVLRRQVRQNRIRVDEALKDYDKLRSGLVTPDQFRACLGRLRFQKFSLSKHSLDLLCSHYATTNKQGMPMIAYTRFVDDMEEVFTVKGMEKDPKKTLTFDPKTFQNVFHTNALSPDEEARVECILDRIRGVVRSRRVLLKPVFQDFDRASKGVYQTRVCSRKRFERVLALNNITLEEGEFELLERKYEAKDPDNNTDNINYVLFCEDLEEKEEPPIPSTTIGAMQPPAKFIRTGKTGKVNFDEVMEDIQSQVLTQRIRLAEFFRDYDQLRSGLITTTQFASGLSLARIEVDAAELDLLCGHYTSDKRPGTVRWMDFCDDIDEVHTAKRLEASPTKTSMKREFILTKQAREKEPNMAEGLQDVLAKMREVVRTRGILLPPFFKDFDTHNTGRITESRLAQVLSRHNFCLSPKELELVVSCYKDPRTRDISYRKLIRDIDQTEDLDLQNSLAERHRQALTMTQSSHPLPVGFGLQEPAPLMTIDQLLSEIKSRIAKDSIRIRDFFVDADRLRKGFVPKSKFRGGLDKAGLRYDEYHLRLLEHNFPSSLEPGAVDYVTFCNTVTVEGSYMNLEKSPTKGKEPFKPQSTRPLKVETNPLDEESSALVDALLDRMRATVETHRLLMKPAFLDFDKIRKGHVTPAQFTAVLDKLQFRLAPHEADLLVKRFQDTKGDVEYMDFLRLVDV